MLEPESSNNNAGLCFIQASTVIFGPVTISQAVIGDMRFNERCGEDTEADGLVVDVPLSDDVFTISAQEE